MADSDPAQTKFYLPYATRKSYWLEAKSAAELEHPEYDWTKTESTFYKTWAGTKAAPSEFATMVISKNKPVSKCKVCEDFTASQTRARSLPGTSAGG